MSYSTKTDVEFYGQFTSGDFGTSGYDYASSIAKAIQTADRMIDDYCNVPESFFNSGGIEIQLEYLNGTDVAYLGGITKFFNWYYGGTSHLKFLHTPVLSVTKLEEETSSGTWTTRTEGTDYIVVEDGIRWIQNTPSWKYKNVRATYKTGYKTTPAIISEVSAKLAAALLRNILDSAKQTQVSLGGATVSTPKASLSDEILSDSLKVRLDRFRCVIYGFG